MTQWTALIPPKHKLTAILFNKSDRNRKHDGCISRNRSAACAWPIQILSPLLECHRAASCFFTQNELSPCLATDAEACCDNSLTASIPCSSLGSKNRAYMLPLSVIVFTSPLIDPVHPLYTSPQNPRTSPSRFYFLPKYHAPSAERSLSPQNSIHTV